MECIAHRNPSKNFNHSPLSLSLPLSFFLLSSPSTLYFLLHSSFFFFFLSPSPLRLSSTTISTTYLFLVFRSPRTRLIPRRASFFICPSGNRIRCFCLLSSLISCIKAVCSWNLSKRDRLSIPRLKIILIPERDKLGAEEIGCPLLLSIKRLE